MHIAALAVDNEGPITFEAISGVQTGVYGQAAVPEKERRDGELNESEFERGMAAVQELQAMCD